MSTASAPSRKGWLTSWDPESIKDWDSSLAWRTLWITTFNLTLAFATWFLVSAIAPKLNSIGFSLTQQQLYWLAAMPGLAGGTLRLVWTFLPPILGTRRLVAFTTALLVIPLVGWGVAVQDPSTPYVVLLFLGALVGLGGGAFSGFMPSTSYFFPRSKQGVALGLQAGIGNFGVSIVQFVTPWVIGFAVVGSAQLLVNKDTGATRDVWFQNAAYFWIPFVIVGTLVAWFFLKSVPVQARGVRDQMDIFRNRNTWLMTYIYVITFGTFSGLAATLGLLIGSIYGSGSFGEQGIDPLAYAFLGALVGSVARIVAGPFADRFGGAPLTLISTLGIGISTLFIAFQTTPETVESFPVFLGGMLAIFFFAGIGNASTFKQMPMLFERRQAGGVIGWTAAIAAYGPFIFGILLSFLSPMTFFLAGSFFAFVGAALTWVFYARPGVAVKS